MKANEKMEMQDADMAVQMEEESRPILRDRSGAFVTVPSNEDLPFRAAGSNDFETVKRLVDNGYDVNTIHEENLNGPFYTIHDSSRTIRQICLKNYTLLHVAVVHASNEIIKFLISRGADVNLTDVNRMSALSLSAIIKRPDVAQILVDAGANINAQSISGKTPLIEAIANGSLPLVNLLIKAGCNLELADLKETTPLFSCIYSKIRETKMDILQSLIQGGANLDQTNKQGATALMLAVGLGVKELAAVLLEAGADINMCDKKGKTVLHLAAGPNMVLYLLNWGASSDRPDNKGIRPLDRAISMGNIGLMRVLLGADAKREYALLDEPSVLQIRRQVPAFDRWLLNELGNPRQLKRLCRQVIRESLSPKNTSRINDLPVPSLVKDFLLVKHLDMAL